MADTFSISKGQKWVPKNDQTVKADAAKLLTVLSIGEGLERGESFVVLEGVDKTTYVVTLHAFTTLFKQQEVTK